MIPVMLPLLLGLLPGLYLGMGATSLPFRGRPMRRDQYMHSFIRMSRSAAAVGVCALVTLAASLIYRAAVGEWLYLAADIRFTVMMALAAALAVGLIFFLRSADVTERENKAFPQNVHQSAKNDSSSTK